MYDFIVALSINLSLLIIWFHTNVLVDYANVLGLNKLFNGFNNAQHYSLLTQYLKENKKILSKTPCCLFYLKLITCPICISFWTSLLLSCLLLNNIVSFPILYITTLYSYFIFNKIV
jgi:hypothetical protein